MVIILRYTWINAKNVAHCWPFRFVFEWVWYRHYEKFWHCCVLASISFWLLLMLLLTLVCCQNGSKFKYTLLVKLTIQTCRNRQNNAKWQCGKWHTRVQIFIHGIVSSLIWCLVAPGPENIAKEKKRRKRKNTESERRMTKVINHFYMSLSLCVCVCVCVGYTISVCPACNWNPPSFFVSYFWLTRESLRLFSGSI